MRNNYFIILLGLFLFFLGATFLWSWPNLKAINDRYKTDTNITFVADADDIIFFSDREETLTLSALIQSLSKIPFRVMAASLDLNPEHELFFRKNGFSLLWKPQVVTDWQLLPDRFQSGDGVFVSIDKLTDHPFYPWGLKNLIEEKGGFVFLPEFKSEQQTHIFFNPFREFLIKGHELGTREMVSVSKSYLWRNRFMRAVRERWVRMFYLRFSPSWPSEENLQFFRSIKDDLVQKGYGFNPLRRENNLTNIGKGGNLKNRMTLVLFFMILTPFVIVMAARHIAWRSPLFGFIVLTCMTCFAGITIQAVGAHPDTILGLAPLRGIKFHLILPLVLAGAWLLEREEWKRGWTSSLRAKHVAWGGAIVLILSVYLMRSGNFPALPATDVERHIRDVLENLFGVRPRTKEFFLGHPLFILGLYLKSHSTGGGGFFRDGRFFLLLGLIGQISILNSFCHFYTPISLNLQRTFFGVLLGSILSLPLCIGVQTRIRKWE